MKYGIYDTVDECWLGDDNGPKLFEDEVVAQVAAQATGVQLGYAPTRIQHKEFIPASLHLRDQVDAKMTMLEALQGIEEGRLL